jgi:uncharacterized protein (TIGR02266 family)
MSLAALTRAPRVRPEVRQSRRARIQVTVDVFANHTVATGLSMNVSEGGVFVATQDTVPMGSIVVIHMTLPFEENPIVTLAEVRWARPYSIDDRRPPGLGLQFIDTHGDSLRRIADLVDLMTDPEPALFDV